ncbi:MAG TPA: T9SS type A sorting domain-containing protein [Saprospiraceae bacterium]|nr:T9SS type A sorting domain-containing protein [Saprospiraceae bacterium]
MNRIWSLCLLFWGSIALSQPGQLFFGNGLIQQVVPAPDGNYFLLGSSGGANSMVKLLKINPVGDVVWEKSYISGANSYGHGLTQLADGSLLIAGQSGAVALLIKTDAEGNELWKRTYANTTALFDVAPSGNQLLLAGWQDNTGTSDSGLLMLVNSNGILQWRKPIDVRSQTYAKRIFPTADGNFLLLGRANDIGAGFKGIFIRKIDPAGNLIWQKTYDTGFEERDYNMPVSGEFFSEPLGMVFMPDESIWMANPYQTFAEEVALLHFSAEGVLLEQKIYGSAGWREFPYALYALPDGGWMICGNALSTSGNADINGFAMRVTADGLEVWRRYYGESTSRERIFTGAALPDGQFLLAGLSNTPAGGGSAASSAWLLRAEADGNARLWRVDGKVVIDLNGNCVADADEPPAVGWFVRAENHSAHILITDAEGNFTFHTEDAVTEFTVRAPDESAWSLCNNVQTIESNSAHPSANLTFTAYQNDGGCPLTEVGITQPDLVRCDTSRFFVTITNRGVGESGDLLLQVRLHPALQVVSASAPFIQNGGSIEFAVPPMQGLQSQTFEIWAQLDCNARLGASHPVVAEIVPAECAPGWSGPRYIVEGRCDGDNVRFDLFNRGGGGAGAETFYRVMADGLLAANWTAVNLPEGEPMHTLTFPADGRTWRVELRQAPGYPSESYPAASVEGCGQGNNGLYSVGYLNSWRYDDAAPEISAVMPANTTGVPDKIAEAVLGLGFYNLHNDLRPLEFTARVRNRLPHTVQKVSFHLTFSPTLDVTSLRPIASNRPAVITRADNGLVHVVMDSLHLVPDSAAEADAMFRFSIQPYADTPPEAGAGSIFKVDAKAYLDDAGPFPVASGFLNYSQSFPVEVDEYNNYPPEMKLFGARNFTFGGEMAQAADGTVLLVGETMSYSDRTSFDGLILKTEPNGNTIWLNAIDLGDQGRNTFVGVAPLSNGGCFVVGNYLPAGAEYILPNGHAYLARLDTAGQLLWHRKIRPAGEQYGSWMSGIVPTTDGNFVMFGYTANADNRGSDQFYIKINDVGEVIWQQYEEITGSAFKPYKAVALSGGELVFTGTNESTDINSQIYFQKIASDGNILWSVEYDTYTLDFALAPTADGGIMFAGATVIPGIFSSIPFFIKLDENGDFQWIKTHVIGSFNYATPYSIKPAPGGGYFVAGEILADTTDHFYDFMLLKIDENAEPLWVRNFGAKNTEWAEDLLVAAPDQILLWGYNQLRPPVWNLHAVLARTDGEGNLSVGTKEPAPGENHRVVVFPNPAGINTNIVLSPRPAKPVHWLLTDVNGRSVAQGITQTGILEMGLERYSAGMYYIVFPGSSYPPARLVVAK